MSDTDHYLSDFPVDFGVELPPQSGIEIPAETQKAILENVVPFCEHLKGKVVSQFVDIEKHIGHLITRAVSGKFSLVPPDVACNFVVAPQALGRKIQILRKLNSFLPEESRLPAEFFSKLEVARGIRNLFAHGTIVFVAREMVLIPVFHAQRDIVIDDEFSKKITLENYEIIEALNRCYVANFPLVGVTASMDRGEHAG